jgi:hypothetical protein
MTTQLSLHTDLRQAGDRLDDMDFHPLREVNSLAISARELLKQKYETSFGATAALSGVRTDDENARNERERWELETSKALTYNGLSHQLRHNDGFSSTIDNRNLLPIEDLLSSRPRGCVLPHVLTALGQVTFEFLLDYGAWRDIQRHRNGVCEAVTLTMAYGFEDWYLDQFDAEWRAKAVSLIHSQEDRIRRLGCWAVDAQYYIPLGYRVPTVVCYGLPAVVYVLEIRSGKTVHPTLRRAVHNMVRQFEKKHPLVKLHVDRDSYDWTVRRGTQTITER